MNRLTLSKLLVAAVLTFVLLVPPAFARKPETGFLDRTVTVSGETAGGDKVSVSSVRVLKNNQRMALVRVEYKVPAQLPQGGPFVEMRARVRFNCASGTAAPTTVWFFSRDRSGRLVVSKKAKHDDDFGKAPEGGFGELASQYVCQQKN